VFVAGTGSQTPYVNTTSAFSYNAATNTLNVTASSANYADLAECYIADKEYEPGTVVVFGGPREVTVSTQDHDPMVAGAISTNPAYLMNNSIGEEGLPIALTGRIPCRVLGPVEPGDVLVTSNIPGVAQRIDNEKYVPGCILGKALFGIATDTIETIEVVVGK
jgi:hypothetical protein